jgi:hypothetical protein
MENEVRWGTKKTRGLTRRMACRIKMLLDGQMPTLLAPLRILTVGLDTGGRNNYVPVWVKNLDLSTYDDSWDDWQPGEIEIIRQRIRKGHDPDDIEAIFRPPPKLFDNVKRYIQETIAPVLATVSDEFSVSEIHDDETRNTANQEWRTYASRVDVSLPTNRSAVRSLIILDIQMRRLDKRMADPNIKVGDLTKLHSDYKNLRQMYSEAAEDVAQLERQRENRDIAYTFSQLIERTHDVRREWQQIKMPLHHQLEESRLIENMVLQHKVDTRPIERFVQRTGNIDSTRTVDEATDQSIQEAKAIYEDPADVVRGVLKE